MSSGAPRPRGEWPMPAHDNRLSAMAELPCGMGLAPNEAWSCGLGETPVRWAMCADVDDDGEEEILFGPRPLVCVGSSGVEKWRADVGQVVAVADVDGDGHTEIVVDGPHVLRGTDGEVLWSRSGTGSVGSNRIHVGPFLKDRRGLQIGCVAEKFELNQAQMWAFDGGFGAGELVWGREFNKGPVYAHATSSAGPFDESRMCVAAAVHGGLVALDPEDGGDLFRFYWQPFKDTGICRNYGALFVGDINGDGTSEFVILNDLISVQLGVLSPSRGETGAGADQGTPCPAPDVGVGELAAYETGPLLWRRYFGHWYPEGEYTLHVAPTSVADVDGDGIPEIVVSVHRERWELKVYDILSGEEKLSVPDLYLHAALDLDGDGVAEIVAASEPLRTPRDFADIEIGSVANAEWVRRFRGENCRLEYSGNRPGQLGMFGRTRDPRTPIDLEVSGERHLILAHDTDGEGRANRFLLVSGKAGADFRAESIDVDGSLDLKVIASGTERMVATGADAIMRALGPDGAELASWPCGGPYQSGVAVADIDGDGVNELLVTNSQRRVVALRGPVGGDGGPVEVWSTDGWGIPAPAAYGPMPIVADFDADGKKEVLTACLSGEGTIGVQLLDSTGRVRWRTPIPGVVDTPLYQGVTRATVGDFNGKGRLDVYVSGRVAMTGNDASHSFVLDGSDGHILWHNDASSDALRLHTLGPTGMPTVADVNGDGVDDVLFVALDLCTELDGKGGSFLHAPLIANGIWSQADRSSQWTSYGTQLPVDIDGDGKLEVLMCASWGQWGAWTMDRSFIWTFDPGREGHSRRHPGIADVDGDGRLELGALHDGGHLRCYEASTGDRKWEISGLGSGTDVVTADVDDDGRPEFVTGGELLSAVKAVDDQNGRILWQVPIPGGSLTPTVADVDGDGLCEIVLSCGDGKVRIYKSAD